MHPEALSCARGGLGVVAKVSKKTNLRIRDSDLGLTYERLPRLHYFFPLIKQITARISRLSLVLKLVCQCRLNDLPWKSGRLTGPIPKR